MAEQKKEDAKIIVDDDWKAQAQAEKEKLAEQATQGDDAAPGQAGPREIPPASVSTLISSLLAQVFMALGGVEDPKTKKRYIDLELAKHHVDMLAVLEEKTKGNLTDQEQKLLDKALYETRMQYVQIAQQAGRAG